MLTLGRPLTRSCPTQEVGSADFLRGKGSSGKSTWYELDAAS